MQKMYYLRFTLGLEQIKELNPRKQKEKKKKIQHIFLYVQSSAHYTTFTHTHLLL
jgi:hypothetical protein